MICTVKISRPSFHAARDHRLEHLWPVDQPPLGRRCRKRLRSRFCGIHFFNPPRYMHLVELIATRTTDPTLLDNLESWLVSRLGKGIVRALDTPNFVANRVGVFSMLAVMHHTQRSRASVSTSSTRLDRSDHRTPEERYLSHRRRRRSRHPGTCRSRPCRTPCRTIPGMATTACPAWLTALIGKGALGQKTRCGIFQQGRPGDQGTRPGRPRITAIPPADIDPTCVGDPQEPQSGREIRPAARQRASAGAVPLGDLPRHLPLRRFPPRRHC
jgi:hypothetical protein